MWARNVPDHYQYSNTHRKISQAPPAINLQLEEIFVAGKDDPDVIEAFNVENVVLFLFLIVLDNRGVQVGERRSRRRLLTESNLFARLINMKTNLTR